MQISNIFNVINNTNYNKTKYSPYTNLRPLAYDTVSFGAMKKNQFKEIDLAVINKFKAPIEKFNSQSDLDNWCNERINNITEKRYPARQAEANIQREKLLEEWFDYMSEEKSSYNPSTRLLVLDAITKDLKEDNDTLPPVLNKKILDETLLDLQDKLKTCKNYQVNFSKLYQTNLNDFYTEDLKVNSKDNPNFDGKTGWIRIPSKKNDPENFEANVEKLKALSHSSWCTKSFNAESSLSDGDFHVYLENKKPKVGIRFVDDTIKEIQGPRNNSKVPVLYAQEVKTYTENNGFKGCEKDITNGIKEKQRFDTMKAELSDAIKNKDWITILNHPEFNCKAEMLDDGLIEVENYNFDFGFSFSDLGINENELFDNIEIVNGTLNLTGSEVTRFKNLREVEWDLNIGLSSVKNTGSLERVGGDFIFSSLRTKIDDALSEVEGEFIDYETEYTNEELKKVLLENKLPHKKEDREGIFKSLGINFEKLEDGTYKISEYSHKQVIYSKLLENYLGITEKELLDNVKIVDGDVDLGINEEYYEEYGIERMSSLTSLGSIRRIGGNLNIAKSNIRDFGNLYHVQGNLDCSGSKVRNLGKIIKIGGDLNGKGSNLRTLSSLRFVGGDCNISNTQLKHTGYLKSVGGDLNICNSNIENLGHLKEVKGTIYLDPYTSEMIDSQLWEKGLWFNSKVAY